MRTQDDGWSCFSNLKIARSPNDAFTGRFFESDRRRPSLFSILRAVRRFTAPKRQFGFGDRRK